MKADHRSTLLGVEVRDGFVKTLDQPRNRHSRHNHGEQPLANDLDPTQPNADDNLPAVIAGADEVVVSVQSEGLLVAGDPEDEPWRNG